MEWSIEPCESVEALRAARYLFHAYGEHLGEGRPPDFDEETSSLPGAYGGPSGILLLAWGQRRPGTPQQQGTGPDICGQFPREVAGCVALRPLMGEAAEVKRLYVLPHRRRQGVATALLRALIGHARALGHRRLLLDTLAEMEPARRLYHRLGFRPIGPWYPQPRLAAGFMSLDLPPVPREPLNKS